MLLSCCLYARVVSAQEIKRFNTYSYTVDDGLLQGTVLDIAFDQNNFCWLSFSNGIQKFDGNHFMDVKVQQGLPADKDTRFFRQKNGSLLIVYPGGISRYDINADKFRPVYQDNSQPLVRPVIIGEDEDKLYLFSGKANLLTFKESDYELLNVSRSVLPAAADATGNTPVFSNIVNHRVHCYSGNQLFYFDLKEKKIITRSPKISGFNGSFIGNDSNDEALFFTNNDAPLLSRYNYYTNIASTVFKPAIDFPKTFRGTIAWWNNMHVLSFYNRLYEMDAVLNVIPSQLIDTRNNPIPGNSSVWKMTTDNFGNLYLVTINEGIKKIAKAAYPFKYFGVGNHDDNYLTSIYADKASNRVLAGTQGSGLLIYDTFQNLKKHIAYLPGSRKKFSVNAITKNSKGDYIFLSASHGLIGQLDADLETITVLPAKQKNGDVAKPVNGYYGSLIAENSMRSILMSGNDIYIINKKSNEIVQASPGDWPVMGATLSGSSLVFHSNDQLHFLDTIEFKTYKKIPFPHTGGVRSYLSHQSEIYLGTNKGIFIIDSLGKVLKHFSKESGMPDECIYAMQPDDEHNIWCSTNKGIFKISNSGKLMQLSSEDGLQDNKFNTNVSFRTANGELFFGGVNGLNSFYPSAIPDFMVDVTIYLTQVKVNNQPFLSDTAVWNIDKMVLAHDQNALTLQFVASGAKNSSRYIHQYKMEGVDNEWIQNDGMQPARYVLPPGKYVFKMYASSFFEKNAVALKELIIIIKPPFYKTWWFITLLGLLLTGLVIYMVNLYNTIRYRKKMAVLITKQKIQQEKERISMELHDSIGAYANAVLYNTELLEAEKEETEKKRLMKDLRFVSKDIITALRETIWALKADNYTAQECFMRIRNFIHPFARYYPGINFKIEGEAPDKGVLHYGEALNIVRIVQEAVNNAIKHGNTTSIAVISQAIGNRWKLTIQDNGIGFDKKLIREGNGLGNMKKRAEELGFNFELLSQINKGTTIIIEIDTHLS